MTVRIVDADENGYPTLARCDDCGDVWTFDPHGETLVAFGLLHQPECVLELGRLRPQPPPFAPDENLIGYLERPQRGPERP